jgi:hypothetical protein
MSSTKKSDPPGKKAIEVEEQTANHWVGAYGDLMILVAFEGSSTDIGHIEAISRLTERSSRRLKIPLKLLFILPPANSRPPSAEVREAIRLSAIRNAGLLHRVSVVVCGAGFGPAIHRAVALSLGALVPRETGYKVHTSLGESLSFLLGAGDPGVEVLRAHLEGLMQGNNAAG